MIKNIDQLAKHLGMSEDEFKQAIQSEEEKEVSIPSLSFDPDKLSDDEKFQSWKSNFKKENENAAREILVKEKKRELGYDFEGKDLDKLLEYDRQKALKDAKLEPEKKVQELNQQLDLFKNQLTEKDQAIEKLNQDFSKTKFEYTLKDKLNGVLSGIEGEKIIPEDKIMALYRMEREIDNEDGNFVVKKNGETMKDSMLNPIKMEDDLKAYAMNYIKKPDGRGEGGQGGTSSRSIDDFNKKMDQDGVRIGSTDYNQKLNQEIESGNLDLE